MNKSGNNTTEPHAGYVHGHDPKQSALIIFCNTLFPGADFQYIGIHETAHQLRYRPYYEAHSAASRKELIVFVAENLIDFNILERNDILHPNTWNLSSTLKYNKLIAYNVFRAYEFLEKSGAIEHHVVDDLLKEPCVVLPETETST